MIHPTDRAERLKINAKKKEDKKASGFKRIAKDQIRDWETKDELSNHKNGFPTGDFVAGP